MNTKLLAIPMLLLAVSLAAPAVEASYHTELPEDGDDDDIEEEQEEREEEQEERENEVEIEAEEDEDDETPVSFEVTESEAKSTAEAKLPNGTWTLEQSERDDDGYYEFDFLGATGADEAEVEVDGVTGAIRSFNVEVEDEADETIEENETSEATETSVSTLEEARERIAELREEIRDLRSELQDRRAGNRAQGELPAQANDRAREAQEQRGPPEDVRGQSQGQAEQEAEIEVEQENGEREVEVEAERQGPSQQARNNVNGTPGNAENRPNFVTRMLQGMFN